MKNKKLISILLAACIAASVTAFAMQSNTQYLKKDARSLPSPNVLRSAKEQLQLADNVYVIDQATEDVTGDAIADTILLVGTKMNPSDIFSSNLDIIVQDGKTKKFLKADIKDFGGYEAQLFVGDFTGDKVSDVMIAAPTGGSGGIVGHRIVTFAGNTPTVIFSDEENLGVKFTGKFIDGFQAELLNENTNRKIVIDISANKNTYLSSNIYNADGKLLQQQKPGSNPFGKLEPVDYDGDGVYELRGCQRIVGAFNADTISRVQSVWKYENNQWTAKEIEVSSFLLSFNESRQAPAKTAYNIVTKLMKTTHAEIHYPQVENMPGSLSMEYINQDLENAAKQYATLAEKEGDVTLNYRVTRQDNDMLSVVFEGTQKWEGGQYEILSSVNVDLKTHNPVFVKNLFKTDAYSQDALSDLLAESAKANPAATKSPSLGDWMGVFFTDREVVLYYLENDFATKHVQLAIPLEEVKAYLNEPIPPVTGVEPTN